MQKAVVARLSAYGRTEFGIDALLFGEEPSRFATFVPQAQAAFATLWALLEIDPAIDTSICATPASRSGTAMEEPRDLAEVLVALALKPGVVGAPDREAVGEPVVHDA